jgi:hypothetical protein
MSQVNRSIIDIYRDLSSALTIGNLLNPGVTGVRSSGSIVVRTSGTEPVFLPGNVSLIPIINGAAREDLAFKTKLGPNKVRIENGIPKKEPGQPEDLTDWWLIQPGGTLVDIHSIVGGKRHNLPAGTKFVFDPVYPGIAPECELYDSTTGGEDPTHFGGCKGVAFFEQMNGAAPDLDAFRAQVGGLPAVVFVWDGTEPADGTTQSMVDRGASRVGTYRAMFKENFNVFVMSQRMDSGPMRRAEGLRLLEDVTHCLVDRQVVDGRRFSNPGIQVRTRSRLSGADDRYRTMFIYLLQISVVNVIEPRDGGQVFHPWLRVHNVFETYEKDEEGNKLPVVDQDIDMKQEQET